MTLWYRPSTTDWEAILHCLLCEEDRTHLFVKNFGATMAQCLSCGEEVEIDPDYWD